MAQKYIVGDLVKVWIDLEIGYQVAEVAGCNPYIPEYILTNWFIEDTIGVISVAEDRIMPIPLTPEILQKNGWEHKDDVYFKEYPHRKLVVMDENAYIINESCSMFLCSVKYVSQLQHLLFGLGINHEMEV